MRGTRTRLQGRNSCTQLSFGLFRCNVVTGVNVVAIDIDSKVAHTSLSLFHCQACSSHVRAVIFLSYKEGSVL